jgi:A/G-specific adenine glycosylase
MIFEPKSTEFSKILIKWQPISGRNHLPWQKDKTPYRVWVSEIMLQQTQVETVINYYDKFLAKFPTLQSLALASESDVLTLWSGLGFYRRAINLHKCAQIIHTEHQNTFPNTSSSLVKLPGIGKSTAAAIASICFNEPAAILDGNVKRVLARYFHLDINTQSEKSMLTLATSLLPKKEFGRYTQAIMDLGSIICKKHKPKCTICPVNNYCGSYSDGLIHQKLTKAIKKRKQNYHYLVIEEKGHWLFLLRENKGIWAKMWAFPEFKNIDELNASITIKNREKLCSIQHTLSHIIMNITFWKCNIKNLRKHPAAEIKWQKCSEPINFATAKPFYTLYQEINNEEHHTV